MQLVSDPTKWNKEMLVITTADGKSVCHSHDEQMSNAALVQSNANWTPGFGVDNLHPDL